MAHVQKYSIVKNIVKQRPLVPAWTCTIHKVQGLSFCKLALNIGSNIFLIRNGIRSIKSITYIRWSFIAQV